MPVTAATAESKSVHTSTSRTVADRMAAPDAFVSADHGPARKARDCPPVGTVGGTTDARQVRAPASQLAAMDACRRRRDSLETTPTQTHRAQIDALRAVDERTNCGCLFAVSANFSSHNHRCELSWTRRRSV